MENEEIKKEEIENVFEEKTVEEKTVEESKQDIAQENSTREASYAETIIEIKQEYEQKINSLITQKDNEIKERDEVIKQLLGNTEVAQSTPNIVDKINAKRNFKKW